MITYHNGKINKYMVGLTTREIKQVTPEMRDKLRSPLPAEAITPHPTKTYLSSIKAIYVTERINDVFGIGAWQLRTEKIERSDNGTVVVKGVLSIPEYGVYYESFGGNDNGGENNKNFDLGDAYKGATTDALTKIASYMEIGIDVFKGKGKKSSKPETKKPDTKTESKVKELDWLNPGTPNWEYTIRRIKESKNTAAPVTIETIKKSFRISKQNEEKLKNETA
jgi:hypothetical protein